MTKAVLFDFDETLQDRTAAFEKYMDTFLDTYCPGISKEEKEKRKEDMRITGKGGYAKSCAAFGTGMTLRLPRNLPSIMTKHSATTM